jgi:antitoxin MazE
MKVELVRIGNSRGIRIPKPLIEQCGLGDTVDLRVEQGCLIIASDRRPRQGWEKAFQAVDAATEDQLLLDTIAPNEFDREEWQW